MEISKYQCFYFVHHVKGGLSLHYERQITKLLYFSSWKIWKLGLNAKASTLSRQHPCDGIMLLTTRNDPVSVGLGIYFYY